MKSKDLEKMIHDNPNLPIKFFVSNDDLTDWSYTLMNNYYFAIDTLYLNDERVYVGEDEALEELCDYYADCEEYKNMTNEEYEIEMKKKVNELEHYKAIVITVNV